MKAGQPLLFILPASSLLFIGQTRASKRAWSGAVRQDAGSIAWGGGRRNAGVPNRPPPFACGEEWVERGKVPYDAYLPRQGGAEHVLGLGQAGAG